MSEQCLKYIKPHQSQSVVTKIYAITLVGRLTRKEVSGHEQLLKTIANDNIQISTDDKRGENCEFWRNTHR